MLVFKYEKKDPISFLSHLDLARSISRTFARMDMKIEKSLGFNPHPIILYALPIPVSVQSDSEYCFVKTEYSIKNFVEDFNKVSINGVKALKCWEVKENPNLAKNVKASEYEITFENTNFDNLKAQLDEILKREDITINYISKRKEREKNIVPLILNVKANNNKIKCVLKSGNEALRPDRFTNAILKELNLKDRYRTFKTDCFVFEKEEKLQKVDDFLNNL